MAVANRDPTYVPNRWRGWAQTMRHATWRDRSTWSQTQGRNIDRIAEGVRPALVAFAMDEVPVDHVMDRINAVRLHLQLVEAQCVALERERSAVPPTNRATEQRR
jgi:hypothetical protein